MNSIFLREQKRYNQELLVKLFSCSEEELVSILKKLKQYGVLKSVKKSDEQKALSDLLDEDIEVADVEVGENENLYVFTYVGVITIDNRLLIIYPKYLLSIDTPTEEMKIVLKVIAKYNSKEQIIRMYNETSDSSAFNLLAVILFLLNDFYEYGSYISSKDIIEINGTGEILWDKTINETFTLLSNNRPIYPDLLTRKRINDDFDYFKRLHEYILTKGTKELSDANLLNLFDIMGVALTDEEISDFGDKEYILDRIEKELNIQFNTRKQLLLKTMYAYISYGGTLADMDSFSMYGTNSYNLIWEKICAEVLDNQLQTPLSFLKLPKPLDKKYTKSDTLISIIEKPIWKFEDENGEEYEHSAKKTLIPDLISVNLVDDKCQFIIFDAKYYNLFLNSKKLSGQPGIESITKQYLYQQAYKEFTSKHGIDDIKNCFLFPTEEDSIQDKGYVQLSMLHGLGLENIQNRMLPASMMYDYYLKNKKMSILKLKL
ncbi:LlaJI family restriction endonuclease [Bacillus sp. GC_Bacil_1]|uniref:LlaJI family restriction endonuclease n=1 Tax=Bacillus sp. GC_Bacil_1 TaxID=2937370 RepID=UPI00226B8210|nr:LlaJI family restriction endonuclease [Bacillus sp. GC_Bacil_1]